MGDCSRVAQVKMEVNALNELEMIARKPKRLLRIRTLRLRKQMRDKGSKVGFSRWGLSPAGNIDSVSTPNSDASQDVGMDRMDTFYH